MPTETVRVDWIQGTEFLLKDHFGFPILMNQPMGINGADLLPLSIIGCAAWDVMAILKKQRQEVTAFEVTAESEREAKPPWRFVRIHIRYRVTGRKLEETAVQRVIALTEQKYCSTFATLTQAIEISSSYEIVEIDDRNQIQSAADRPSTAALASRFNEALNAGDVDAMMALMSDDCVFENTFPAPDGARYAGKPAVRAFWEAFMQNSRQPRIEIEETIAAGDRCILRWTYHWLDAAGNPGHVRGVDIFRIRDGMIQEKLSYVKG